MSALRALVAALALMIAGGAALAGVDVSLDREYQRLMDAQRRIEDFPSFREAEDLKRQLAALQEQLEDLARQDPARVGVERESLRRRIDTLQRRMDELAKLNVPFDRPRAGGDRERFFPGARHRIAVFTFDDPHGTGLGDPVSFLLSKKLLFGTRVTSFAVVNYRQGVDRQERGLPAYFDRVDAVTRDQGFLLAVWGRLSRAGDRVQVESFLQVPTELDGTPYLRRVRLPEAMGGGALTARLKPDRIAMQRLAIDPDDADALRRAADDVATLRAEPSVFAPVVGRLGELGVYRDSRAYRIVDSRRDWVRLRFDDGGGGWTSVDAFCRGTCRRLMDAATFANDVLALAAGQTARDVPEGLSREASAVSRQLAALIALEDDPRRAAAIAESWAAGKQGGPPPGGAAFVNLVAVARLAAALQRAGVSEPRFDSIRLDRGLVGRTARDLAAASVADPADLDVLDNLAVLFGYLGDDRRQGLARQIAADLRAR